MSLEDPSALIQKYQKKGLLVDSNLLLLFFIGNFNPALINSHKRTRSSGFAVEDFELLKGIMARFQRIITTPHILTEVSNLSKMTGGIKDDYFKRFGVEIIQFDEQYTAARDFCSERFFPIFGLTDSAIIHASRNNYLVLTADFPLFGYLKKNKIDAINFNRLRQNIWE